MRNINRIIKEVYNDADFHNAKHQPKNQLEPQDDDNLAFDDFVISLML